MIAVLQVCSDAVNKELNETDKYEFSNTDIFKIIYDVRDVY